MAERRLGKWGLRPFGSNKPITSMSANQGSRMPPVVEGKGTTKQPPAEVFNTLRAWLREKRMDHGNEVRGHIKQRLQAELQRAVDKQLVLQEHKSSKFNELVLEAATAKLKFLQVHKSSARDKAKKVEMWLARTVFPAIGATFRTGQNKSQSGAELDADKFLATVK